MLNGVRTAEDEPREDYVTAIFIVISREPAAVRGLMTCEPILKRVRSAIRDPGADRTS
jgi:hypothetical protein